MAEPTIREAQAALCEIGATLHVQDFTHGVILVTHDSVQVFDNARARRYGPWLLIWTEHQGYHFQHEDEVVHFRLVDKGKRFSDLDEVVR